MTMKWNRKTIIGLVFMLPLLMVIVWFGLYEFAAKRIEAYIEKASKHLNEQGYTVSYDKLSFSGTFLEATATLSNLKILQKKNLYSLQSPTLNVSISPWNYKNVNFSLGEATRLTVPATSGWNVSEVLLNAPSGTVTLDEKNRAKELSFSIDTITPTLVGKKSPITFFFLQVKVDNIREPLNSGGNLSFQVAGLNTFIKLKDFNDPMQVTLNYNLTGLTHSASAKSLQEWRNAGGKIVFKTLDIDWLTLKVAGKGELSLDKKMRLQGSLQANFTGYEDAIGLWVDAGYIKKKDADTVNFIINMLAGQPEIGKKEVFVPVTIKKGYLSIGPAKFLKIPAVE